MSEHAPTITTGTYTSHPDREQRETFVAECPCGWTGPTRARRVDAEDDAHYHVYKPDYTYQ